MIPVVFVTVFWIYLTSVLDSEDVWVFDRFVYHLRPKFESDKRERVFDLTIRFWPGSLKFAQVGV